MKFIWSLYNWFKVKVNILDLKINIIFIVKYHIHKSTLLQNTYMYINLPVMKGCNSSLNYISYNLSLPDRRYKWVCFHSQIIHCPFKIRQHRLMSETKDLFLMHYGVLVYAVKYNKQNSNKYLICVQENYGHLHN